MNEAKVTDTKEGKVISQNQSKTPWVIVTALIAFGAVYYLSDQYALKTIYVLLLVVGAYLITSGIDVKLNEDRCTGFLRSVSNETVMVYELVWLAILLVGCFLVDGYLVLQTWHKLLGSIVALSVEPIVMYIYLWRRSALSLVQFHQAMQTKGRQDRLRVEEESKKLPEWMVKWQKKIDAKSAEIEKENNKFEGMGQTYDERFVYPESVEKQLILKTKMMFGCVVGAILSLVSTLGYVVYVGFTDVSYNLVIGLIIIAPAFIFIKGGKDANNQIDALEEKHRHERKPRV